MTILKRKPSLLLWLIVILYCLLGTLYAIQTPRWQTPDEPAHFNYVQYVAQNSRFPVLQVGDYPAQYLEEIKAARFPPHMPIASIRYESHQPPLYYVLAAILYRLTAGLPFQVQFVTLRLFSVALGAALLIIAYRLVRDILPDEQFLALATAGFIAVVPMHIALTAAINNDTLAELLLMMIVWQSIRAIQKGFSQRQALTIGILLGLALLTKTTVYLPAVGAVLLALYVRHCRRVMATAVAQDGVRTTALTLGPALLMAAPWLVRNALVYGNWDFLGWKRHELVVAGQLRSAELLARIGPLNLARQFLLTTFRSFWAQFGWMGVPVDQRIYLGLALLSAILCLGWLIFVTKVWRGIIKLEATQSLALMLLSVSVLLTLTTYLGYNLGFAQHQGRYLFPALGPLGVGAALSLRELLQAGTARKLTVLLLLLGLAVLGLGLWRGGVSKWGLALLIANAALWGSAGWLPRRWRWLLPAALYCALLALDAVCLFVYVVPFLR
jgi:4-amino-4-deoxy-L-arabinose transferase-like glycosyltransferase